MELSLQMKQTQKLSPQMIQTMEILQMGNQELQEYVDELLLENPVLERTGADPAASADELLRRMEWLLGDGRRYSRRADTEDAGMAPVAVQPRTEGLYEHLRDQIEFRNMSMELRLAVESVLTGLDANGYLEESTQELADRSGQPLEVVAEAEKLIRTLEPTGVGARTLAQCLELQLERQGERGLALTIVRNHLEDVAKNRYHKIAQETGASRESVQKACRLIRTLVPKPGAAFAPGEHFGTLLPDLVVREENGKFVVTMNEVQGPLLRVNSFYQRLLAESDDPQVQEYLTNKMRQADWVVKGIEQRRTTLLRCGQSIAAAQEEFLRRGPGHLKPMTMSDLAVELGVHPSTVSRTVRDKYLQCGYGVFPLSYFFSRALSGPEGEEATAQQAKAAIYALIQEEDKRHPLSDQKLCDLLAQQELILARRTVAKYREAMGIAPAAGRREY